jgi:hypothetical protein
MSAALRVADVFRSCWEKFGAAHPVAAHPGRVVRHLLDCRTAALGGHLYRCETCGGEVPMYNSCQDRHCPTCQTLRKQEWLEARRAEILPVPYFHTVFTLPHTINPLIGANRELLLDELFGAVNWVLQRFAADPQWKLEGQLGYVAVLHTWTQKLLLHYHLHCLVPGGAWNAPLNRWRSAHRRFLFGKDALAKAFQARFIRRLQTLRRRRKLAFTGDAATLASPAAWDAFIQGLWKTTWIVYPKATGKNPEQALDYLARYTHKVAIGDWRIQALAHGEVTFSWRDRADANRLKPCTLPVERFVARFLLHILPEGFAKVRHFGWLASRRKKHALPAIRAALGAAAPPPPPAETTAERILRLTGVDVRRCPHCGKAALAYVGRLNPDPAGLSPNPARAPP